jgi:hypothetical protein
MTCGARSWTVPAVFRGPQIAVSRTWFVDLPAGTAPAQVSAELWLRRAGAGMTPVPGGCVFGVTVRPDDR